MGDVDLLQAILESLPDQECAEHGIFRTMLDSLEWRARLTPKQREWAERVAAQLRIVSTAPPKAKP